MSKTNKPKLKLIVSPKGKSAMLIKPKPSASDDSNPQTIEQLATIEFWKNEIASLKSGKYKSIDQATEILIDQVLKRLNIGKAGHEDVREFMRLVFESSEVLQDTLRRTLNLKT